MILHILIVLASVGSFGIVQAQLVEPDTIITYYDRFDVAVSFFEKGRYRLAQSHFQHILTNEKEFYDSEKRLFKCHESVSIYPTINNRFSIST